MTPRHVTAWQRRRRREAAGFALPGISLLTLVVAVPLGYAVLLAFSSFTLLRPHLFPLVGLDNFEVVLADPALLRALRTTLAYTAATVGAEFAIGLGVALLLDRVTRFRSLYLMVLALPMAASPVSVGLIARMLLQPNLGIANALLGTLGIPPVDWLGRPGTAFWTVVGVDVWQQVSFMALMLAAGLAALPTEPYEAAAIDGAGPVRRLTAITWPLLRPVAAVAVIIQTINEIRTYDLVYVMTRGGPGQATDVLSYLAYRRAFLGLSLNEGSAIALVLTAATLVLTGVFLVQSRR